MELTDADLTAVWGMPFRAMVKILYRGVDTVENIVKNNLAIEHRFPKTLQPGVLDILEQLLASGIAVAILTACHRESGHPDLVRLGFPVERLLRVQYADDSKYHKPDPRVFDPILPHCHQLGIEHHEILVVGDSLNDMHASLDAELDFLAVTTGEVDALTFGSHGVRSIATLSEILPIILNSQANAI